MTYDVIPPKDLFKGRTYADYLVGFWKWLYSVDCDRNNTGDVAYLRGVAKSDAAQKRYLGEPVIMVEENRLNITPDQGVFFCNITTNTEAVDERADYQEAQLRGACLADLRQSTLPINEQIVIDGEQLDKKCHPVDHKIITGEFLLHVPYEEEYGSSINPFMDAVLAPGDYRCVASGYCFLIKFNDATLHTIYSIGRGKPWTQGDYISEYLYEINVSTGVQALIMGDKASLPNTAIKKKLEKMAVDKVIDKPKLKKLKEAIGEAPAKKK